MATLEEILGKMGTGIGNAGATALTPIAMLMAARAGRTGVT